MKPRKAQVKDKGLAAESGDFGGWVVKFDVLKVREILQISGPRRARTVDPRIKSPLLYRLSYRPH